MPAPATNPPSRTIIAGIDEAGYGPLLGPLVVTATAFEVPTAASEACLWDTLSSVVAVRSKQRDARLVVADSKKLYHGPDDLWRLELPVLAMLATAGRRPKRLPGLLGVLCPQAGDDLATQPWYAGPDTPLPLSVSADRLALQAQALGRGMKRHGVRLAGVWSELLPADRFNRLVAATGNKSVVLMGCTLRLVQRIAMSVGSASVRFVIDKQGGRCRYRRPLLTAFEDRPLRIVAENAEVSAYRLSGPDGGAAGTWHIEFLKNGERHHLPIALASMVSKYLRESLMLQFNAFWQRHVPDLVPTAGYYTDARRFLRQIAGTARELRIDRAALVRSR